MLIAATLTVFGVVAVFVMPSRQLLGPQLNSQHGSRVHVLATSRPNRNDKNSIARGAVAESVVSSADGFDFGRWWSDVVQNAMPALRPIWEAYSMEVGKSLADWTPVLIIVVLFVIRAIFTSGKDKDEFNSEEEDQGAGFMFGMGGKQRQMPKLSVTSLNRQMDRYSLSVTRATKGKMEAQKLKEHFTQGYKEMEKAEASSADKKPSQTSKSGEDSEQSLPRRIWVLKFQQDRNDVQASGVKLLREEISAVIMAADPARDEVVLRLDSPGGTVTGYGLAGAQLMRLRDAGLRLTVAIDQVAASGGYLMACTAHHIVCSPFAIIGSIGVVQELPIVFDRLQREGITFETTTAGKFKRTLTPFKQPTEEDRQKNKEDLQDVLKVFKEFVSSSRPSVDIDAVATGDTWLGPLAKEQGLVDELKTSDTLLLDHIRDGRQVLLVDLAQKNGNGLESILQGVMDMASTRFPAAAAALSGETGPTASGMGFARYSSPMAEMRSPNWMIYHGD